MRSPALSEFLSGLRDEAPILVGVVPFGMIYGVLAMQARLPVVAAQAMSSVLFAGSAQLIAVKLLGTGSPVWVVVLTVFVVNLRHALYSASMAPYLSGLSAKWKALLGYLLTDEAYAVSIARFAACSPAREQYRHLHLLGSGIALWTSWQLSTAAGVFLGAQVPSSWSLDFTLALTFIAVVIPSLKDRAVTAAAVAAGVTALLCAGLPYKLGLVAAAVVGIAAGMLSEKRTGKR
jgi:4-azaleucine resistance transporter AzlC